MNKKGTASEYLKKAMAGELGAARQYAGFSFVALKEGFENTALLFSALEQAENIHYKNHLSALGQDYSPETEPFTTGTSLENLLNAINTENYEYNEMYPEFMKSMVSEPDRQYYRVAQLSMEWAMKVEKTHAKILTDAAEYAKRGLDFDIENIYICRVCGNIEIGSDLPDTVCPVCGHDRVFYKPMKENQQPYNNGDAFIDKFHLQGGEIIRQITFGMNDGVVSIFALLAGVAGAGQSPQTILIALLAATVAGALSMAAGEFISGKSESDYYSHEINQERLEIELVPDIEKEEVERIYRAKGFTGELLKNVTDQITEDRDRWAREMAIDELGVTELEQKSGFRNSIVIFFAFAAGACFPVLPYLILLHTSLDSMDIFYVATFITVAGLFLAGALKTFVTGVNWFKSGLEMLLVGLFAYGISYLIGTFIPF